MANKGRNAHPFDREYAVGEYASYGITPLDPEP
jgi:hypothetical protein